jgi:hypothetical protein
MHILTHEEGEVRYLHYGLFEDENEPLLTAQERSTELLLSRLPPPPARLLEVGIGLGTTLSRLLSLGYDAEGITPDEHQIAMAGPLPVHCARFEEFEDFRAQGAGGRAQENDLPCPPYDTIIFQESSQYIDSDALFAKASQLATRILVLDEFALQPIDEEGALHSRDAFLAAAQRHGFHVTEERDLSAQAAPTMSYFTHRIPAWRERLLADLGLSNQQIDELVLSGAKYRERYANGIYGYRLLSLRKE